jgi:hypothetical protein
MSSDFQKIKDVARESLMADFFAVRIDEEGLWNKLQEFLLKIQTQSPVAYIEKLKQIVQASSSPNDFIEKVKAANLWNSLKDLIAKIPVK